MRLSRTIRPPDQISWLLTEVEAANFLAVSPETLRCWRWARRACGPDYIKLGPGRCGQIRYSFEALRRFVRERTRKGRPDEITDRDSYPKAGTAKA